MTSTTIDGNIFENNGQNYNWQSALALDDQGDESPSGTIENNFYDEPAGITFENSADQWSSYTQSNNNAASSIYNAADGFSDTEGTNAWSYFYWPGSGGYENLSFNSTNVFWGSTSSGYWSDSDGGSVSQFDMTPDTSSSDWIYRVWTAPSAGTVSVRGRVLKNQVGGGTLRSRSPAPADRSFGRAGGRRRTLEAVISRGMITNLDGISVSEGDQIAFCLNNSSGNSANSTVSWAPTVVYTSGGGGGGSSNLLTNPGFESGTTGWTGNEASISADSSDPEQGSYYCQVSGRTEVWGSAMHDITGVLNANGQGNYNLSGWMAFASGSDGAFLVIRITDSAGTHFVTTSTVTVGTTWTELSATNASIAWTGTLSSALLYADDDSSLNDIYLDNFSLTVSP